MAQAGSRRHLNEEARLRSPISPYEFCGGQGGIRSDFVPSTSVLICQYNVTSLSV